MKEKLNQAFALLNDVEVKRKQNLNNILAAMQLIEEVYNALDKIEQSNQEKN